MKKFLHSTIIASVGWYLMVPPIHGGTIDYAAPLSQWQIAADYATEDWCEAAKLKSEGRAPGPTRQNATHADPRLLAAQCISSSNPRLVK